jgi:hypothetical protein
MMSTSTLLSVGLSLLVVAVPDSDPDPPVPWLLDPDDAGFPDHELYHAVGENIETRHG